MKSDWSGRHILITGGSRGIGLAISHHFAKAGAHVVATSQSEEGCEKIRKKAAASGLSIQSEVLKLDCELSRESFVNSLKEQRLEIDTLINNAGLTNDQISLRMKKEYWYKVLESNLSGTFFITQSFLRGMLKNRFGRIISLSSIVAATGNMGQVNYCASKAGVIGMSKALALEVGARGITVNVISPGFIDTEMTEKLSPEQKKSFLEKIPMGRFGYADDIGHACLFLANVESSYITGQVLHINGGLYTGH